jgi:hypothetical protein
MNPLIQLKKITSLNVIAVLLACFEILPRAQAVTTGPEDYFPNNTTAVGQQALLNLTTGYNNTANGYYSLWDNTTGVGNTATGSYALYINTNGSQNTATGLAALSGNTTGDNNTATGSYALWDNTTGTQNTATGREALERNTTANNNTAVGFHGALQNTTGANNTAIGHNALAHNTIGSSNIALGKGAGVFLTTGSNNIDIGSAGVGGESNTIRIGSVQTRTFIKGISGVALAGATVVVNAAGQLGVAASSAHFKHKIRPMDKESEAILALKPVSFCYDQDIDEQGLTQFGLVAEDVEKVNPDLVVRDEAGKPYSVRYDQVNAMLLNEFLKAHSKMEEQQATIAQLKSAVEKQEASNAQQQKQIETLTAGLQKVSAQIELSKAAPKTVQNGQ